MFTGKAFGDREAQYLSSILRFGEAHLGAVEHVTSLDLGDNELGDQGAEALAEIVAVGRIASLNLHSTCFARQLEKLFLSADRSVCALD